MQSGKAPNRFLPNNSKKTMQFTPYCGEIVYSRNLQNAYISIFMHVILIPGITINRDTIGKLTLNIDLSVIIVSCELPGRFRLCNGSNMTPPIRNKPRAHTAYQSSFNSSICQFKNLLPKLGTIMYMHCCFIRYMHTSRRHSNERSEASTTWSVLSARNYGHIPPFWLLHSPLSEQCSEICHQRAHFHCVWRRNEAAGSLEYG